MDQCLLLQDPAASDQASRLSSEGCQKISTAIEEYSHSEAIHRLQVFKIEVFVLDSLDFEKKFDLALSFE